MHKDQKHFDLNQLLIKLQKPVILLMFFAIIVVFVYSLIYMTPFFEIYKADATLLNKYLIQYGLDVANYDEASWFLRNGKVIGLNISYFTALVRDVDKMQAFNQWIFKISVLGILLSLLLFIYFSQKRKRYYVTNFVTIVGVSAFDIYVGCSLISRLTYWKQQVGLLKFEVINAYLSSLNGAETFVEYFNSASFDWIFIVGYIVAVVIIVVAILGLVLVAFKFVYQLKNKPIDTSEVKINE